MPKSLPDETYDAIRRDLLVDIANLDEHGIEEFWERWKFIKLTCQLSDRRLLKLRDELRSAWTGKAQIYPFVHKYLKWRIRNVDMLVPASGSGGQQVVRNTAHLPMMLATGVWELLPKLGYCGAEGCPAPYFLRYHRDQKFCSRPACLQYGQRLHKREWARKRRAREL